MISNSGCVNIRIAGILVGILTIMIKIKNFAVSYKLKYQCMMGYLPDLKYLIALLTFGLISSNSLSDDDSSSGEVGPDYNEFIYWLKRASDEKEIPGAALAIVSREEIIYLQTWGLRDVGASGLVQPESVFRIASMSKTFAGTSAAMLVDRDLQSWDAKLTDILPNLRLGNRTTSRNITLRHLASQSTGLMPHSYSNMLDDGVVYDKIRQKFHEIPTVCAPGKCYGYQNVVFSLIADVVEESAGLSYERFLEEEIFRPLGMTTASVGLNAYESDSNATAPHRLVRGSWRSTTTNPAYYSVAPASGINASILDMAIWVRANLGAFPEVMSPNFLAAVHQPVIATSHGNYFNRWQNLDNAHYGIGWRIFDYNDLRVVHHGGGVRGFRSEMAFVPERNVGMVLLFNAGSNLANDIVPAFLDKLDKPR